MIIPRKTIVIAAGVGAAVVVMSKKTKRKKKPAKNGGKSDGGENVNERYERLVEKWEAKDKLAKMGHLYQIRYGDSLFEISREALFGTRDPVMEDWKNQAIFDYAERIECGPWNQTNYAVGPDKLDERHGNWVKTRPVQKGISFMPIYSDNKARMMMGLKPSADPGDSYAFAWLPMINLDIFKKEKRVTLEGANWPDTPAGMGHSMIDPPSEILDFGFSSISSSEVGCPLPEGDFRRTFTLSE